MATTTLLQRHAGEGETIAEAIRDCLDYGKDPEKTESGKYISAYVIMAMEDCGFSKKDIRRVVGQLYEVFDLNSVEDAKEKYLSSPY